MIIDPLWMDWANGDSAVAAAHELQTPSWLLPASTTLSTLSLFGLFFHPQTLAATQWKTEHVQHVGVFTLFMTRFGIFHLSLKNKP